MSRYVSKYTGSEIDAGIERGLNSAPTGFGYGEPITYKSWSDANDTAFESFIDTRFANEKYTGKVVRISELATYPANVVSGNGGYADVQIISGGNGILVVGYFHLQAGKPSIAIKQKLNGVWYPWEYVNPPMESGVVYRTTERLYMQPVYKRNNNGVIEWTIDNVTWHTYAAQMGAAPAGFGLGDAPKYVADANDAILSGWYQAEVNSPTGEWCDIFVVSVPDGYSVTQFAFDRYAILGGYASYYWMRTKRNADNFSEWEIVNPPMHVDVEYRTTERYLGKPVYAKVVNFGALPNETNKTVSGWSDNVFLVVSHSIMLTNGANVDRWYGINNVFITKNEISIKTTGDQSGYYAYVTVYYTKTTD